MKARTAKDMSVVRRTLPFAKAFREKTSVGLLKNYAGTGLPVRMRWNLNKEATRDRMFELKIGDHTAIIDLEELLSYTRLV